MTTGTRKPGEFCWSNMITPQPAAARDFFAAMFGWTYQELPGLGHSMRVDGHDIGAMFDRDDPSTPKGTAPHIGVLVMIADADAFTARVIELGGEAHPPFAVAEQGRMVICADPNGARFDAWEPKKATLTDGDSHAHGAATFHETLTTDIDRATAFYTALFGWTPVHVRTPEYAYTTFSLRGIPVAGMMEITPPMAEAGVTPHWGTYFAVRDTDEAARVAVANGGALFIPPHDIPNVGRFCGVTSPQGVRFYCITYPPR